MPSSPLSRLPGLLALGWLVATPVEAQAQARRMVVRLQSTSGDLDNPVKVRLVGDGGAEAEVALKDDGRSPDVTADDGMWSATVEIGGDTVQVYLLTDGEEIDGGMVTWTDTTAPRDLDLNLSGGTLTAKAASAEGGLGPPPEGAPPGEEGQPVPGVVQTGEALEGLPPVDGPPVEGPTAETPPVAGPQANGPPLGNPGPPNASGPATETGGGIGDAQLFIGLGVGILALVGVGWLWFVNRRRGEDELPPPQPEPGLLGPLTPSLSAGSSTWRADPEDFDAFAWALLARVARHRKVVLATTEGIELGPVFGGPVYRSSTLDVAEIADMADALEEKAGAPVAVVLVGDAATETLPGLRAELSASTGLILIGTTRGTVEPRALRCSRSGTGNGWRIEGPDGVTGARSGAFGLEPPPPEAP